MSNLFSTIWLSTLWTIEDMTIQRWRWWCCWFCFDDYIDDLGIPLCTMHILYAPDMLFGHFFFICFFFFLNFSMCVFFYYCTYGMKWKQLTIFSVMLIKWATSGWYLLMFRSKQAIVFAYAIAISVHIKHTSKIYASMHMRLLCLIVELMFQDKTNSLICSFSFVHFTINSFQSVSSFNPFLLKLNASKLFIVAFFSFPVVFFSSLLFV